MRIALVVLRFDAPGGVETTARQLAHGYLARGHEVEIFASDLYDEGRWDRRRDFAPTFEGATVHRFNVYKRLLPHVTFVTMPGLMRALVAARPDVIEAHSHRYGQVLESAAVSLATGIPLVVGPHYHPADVRARWYKRGILRVQVHAFGMTAYRVARFLVVETATEAAQMAEFAPRERIRVVPPGLELDEWLVEEPAPATAGYLARLPPGDRRPIVLMGKDWGEGPRLRAQAERAGIAGQLLWLGHVPSRAEYRAVFRRASALILPSEYEAFGFVLMEAMAVGLPIVGTAVGAVPEVLEQGRIGEIVRFGDVAGLAAALTALAEAPERWRERIARGRQRVLELSVDRMVDGHLALYREALARP